MDSRSNRSGRATTRRDVRTRRELQRQATRDEILDAARLQIAAGGTAALSLREIARQMRLTAPALYRYFKSRDDLLIALTTTAFRSFADTLEAARDATPTGDPAQRFLTIGLAYRKWALAHPQDYILIFATPTPDCAEPANTSTPEARRSLGVLFSVLNDAWQADQLKLPLAYTKPSAALQAELNRRKKEFQIPYKTPIMFSALVVWSRVHGLVSLELVGQLPGFLGEAVEELYRTELLELGRQFGLKSTPSKRIK